MARCSKFAPFSAQAGEPILVPIQAIAPPTLKEKKSP